MEQSWNLHATQKNVILGMEVSNPGITKAEKGEKQCMRQ